MGPILRGTFVTLLVLVAVAAAGWRVVEANVAEFYSRGWYSGSSAEAERRGVLLRRPIVLAESLRYGGGVLRVTDAWIEQVTRAEYPYYLWRREVREPAERLVLLTRRDAAPDRPAPCREVLALGDGSRLAGGGTPERGSWHEERRPDLEAPFPDTIRLHVHRRGEGCDGGESP